MILNLTQHPATAEQVAAGVVDLTGAELVALKKNLTFDALPTSGDIADRASWLSGIAIEHSAPEAMIGGAGYLLPELERQLREAGIRPLHAFTQRVAVESVSADGSVAKTAIFKHAGFVRA